MSKHLRRWNWLILIVLLGMPWGNAHISAQSPDPLTATNAPAAVNELPGLAQAGRFAEVLQTLRGDTRLTSDNPVAMALLRSLELHEQHEQTRLTKNREAYTAAWDKMKSALEAGKIEEGMLALIDAHSVSENIADTLAAVMTQELINKTEAAAKAAQESAQWLDALSLYRLLDALFDQSQKYRASVRANERHIRIMRLYVPDELKKQFVARATRLSKENLDPPSFGNETWEQQLTGVDMTMLEAALARTSSQHVSSAGYRPLLVGALDGLLTLAQTPQLSATFPNMGDGEKVRRFIQAITDLRLRVATQTTVGGSDMRRLLEQVATLNRDTLDLPDPVLAYEMGDGALSNADDFSAILWPREKEELTRTTRGKFFGVGIMIGMRTDPVTKTPRITVVSPLANTPAHKAGIKPGDIIAMVDGQPTTGWTIDQAVRTITGPEGTTVTLGIDRPEVSDRLFMPLQRNEIPIESVRGWDRKSQSTGDWDFFIDPDNRIGYVRLSQFVPQSATDLDAAINQMEQTGPIQGLILDLRYDPGGLLSAAVEVTNRFVRQGTIVSTVRGDGKENERYQARPERTYRAFPMVVLINEGSASASEIVAGALQDYSRATIVGQRSFGKGSVQDLFVLGIGKAFLKVTTQYYKLPKGRIIHRQPGAGEWGIEPDLAVKVTPQQAVDALEYRMDLDVLRDASDPPKKDPPPSAAQILEQGMDPQLEAALLVLKTRIVAQQMTPVAEKR